MADRGDSRKGDFERFRAYLNVLARSHVDRRLHGKLDPSGVVQQTLLEAHCAVAQLRAQTDEQQAAWLRRTLMNNLVDELRRLRANKRDLARERSLDAAINESSTRIGAWLVAVQSSPSHQAMLNEESLRLAAALAGLPDEQRRVIELHHFAGLSLAQVGDELGHTKGAVAGLLHRGLAKLRELLGENT